MLKADSAKVSKSSGGNKFADRRPQFQTLSQF